MTIPDLYSKFLECSGVSTDTRSIGKDNLFFALKGENFNGNKFAQQALESGAKYAVIDEEEYAISESCILVEDVLSALQQLATYHRQQFDIPVIGITGSNGKTTTKELMHAVLSTQYDTLATIGNLNNQIGVPLTLLRLASSHEIAIIEMGASYKGNIEELCEFAQPQYGIITNIGSAHIEGFGSLQGVIDTKTELYRHIEAGNGTIFLHASDELLQELAPKVTTHSYGIDKGTYSIQVEGQDPFLSITVPNYGSTQTKLYGLYNAANMAAAACIGNHFKISAENISKALEAYTPSNNRTQIIEKEQFTVYLDAYNANPTSMDNALQFFKSLEGSKTVIMGDMKELGHISDEEHERTLNDSSGFDQTILVGPEFMKLKDAYPSFIFFNHVDDLKAWIKENPLKNEQIFIKGSRGIALEKVLEVL